MLFSQSAVNCTGSSDQDQVLVHFAKSLKGSVLGHDGDDKLFYIIHEEKEIEVQNCFVDPLVRNCSSRFLISFFENNGYLIVKQFDDGTPYIKAKMRLNGGGALFCIALTLCISWTGIAAKAALCGSLGQVDIGRRGRENQIFMNKLDIAATKLRNKNHDPIPARDKKIPVVKNEPKCVVGPGIPIARLPINIPGTKPPILKMPKEIIRQPVPIIIGPTIHV